MALVTKTFPVLATTTTRVVAITCDVCGATSPHCDGWGQDDGDHRDEVVIQRVEGRVYPEGGILETRTWDICPGCFGQHVIPFLQGLGAEPRDGEITI